ncbi:retrovirus-related pol polyprotein from transposon TNT 1-94 [Tanacetum coccineum]
MATDARQSDSFEVLIMVSTMLGKEMQPQIILPWITLPPEVLALVSNHMSPRNFGTDRFNSHARNFIDEKERSVNEQPKFSQPDSGLIVPVFQKGDDPIDAINHMMSFLTAVGRQTSLAVDTSRTYTPGATDDLDAYESDCDELNIAKVVLMANLSHYGSVALDESIEIDRLKQTLSEHLKEKESLMQTVTLLKNDFKKEESRNIVLEPKLYDGNVIKNTSAIVIPDSEETLMLAEESRSKMLLKQKDPMMLEKKVNTTPNAMNSPKLHLSSRPTKVEVSKELPKVSMVNTSLKKLKYYLASFDVVVKERTTPTAITEGSKPTALENETPKPVVTLVYSRKPRKSKTNVPISKSKVLKSVSANKKEPSPYWGSIVSDVPYSSLDECKSSKLFFGIVKFGNDHVAKILGYGDNQIRNVTISRVYYVEGLGHNLFSVGSKDEALDFIIKFLKMIQVRLKVPVRRIRTYNGTKFVNQTLREYYEKVDISHETSVARSPQQNGVVERRKRMLIKAARTMLIYAKASLFLWAEAVATACYTQNRSIIRLRHGKTPYELLHDKPPDLSFFHVFGALCYPTNDSENFGRLMPNPPPSTPFVPPLRTDWDILFQPLFDELLTHPPSVDPPAPEVIVPIHEVVALVPAVSTSSPYSTNVDQDAPSPNELGRYSKNKASISGSWGYVKKRKLILKSLFAPVAKIKAIRICLGNLPLKSNRSSTIIGCFKTAFLAHMIVVFVPDIPRLLQRLSGSYSVHLNRQSGTKGIEGFFNCTNIHLRWDHARVKIHAVSKSVYAVLGDRLWYQLGTSSQKILGKRKNRISYQQARNAEFTPESLKPLADEVV